jgi:hypothetical protein
MAMIFTLIVLIIILLIGISGIMVQIDKTK